MGKSRAEREARRVAKLKDELPGVTKYAPHGLQFNVADCRKGDEISDHKATGGKFDRGYTFSIKFVADHQYEWKIRHRKIARPWMITARACVVLLYLLLVGLVVELLPQFIEPQVPLQASTVGELLLAAGVLGGQVIPWSKIDHLGWVTTTLHGDDEPQVSPARPEPTALEDPRQVPTPPDPSQASGTP